MNTIRYEVSPPLSEDALNGLFTRVWVYVCAFAGMDLVGFVNVAWDGDEHAFLLDTTVDPAHQRRGIGRGLIERATEAARDRGAKWLHVDFEPHLERFYRGAGFRPTAAGLIRLDATR